jgi:L-arabonate dehydrase
VAENNRDAEIWNADVIRARETPLRTDTGIAVLRGNLAPDGAVIKPAAARPRLLRHTGRALVFDDVEDLFQRRDDDDLEIDADSVMVLKNSGPRGYPGMPEVGRLAVPRKLIEQGIDDIVRISDARMSGTAYGTVVLHVAPESAAGGPLALVQNGDRIELDVERRKLELRVGAAELARRSAAWSPPPMPTSGYASLFVNHVLQADRGADFDFFVGRRGTAVRRDNH